MLQQVPGALARLGVRTAGPDRAPDIHQPTFGVDEACIAGRACRVLAELADDPVRADAGLRRGTLSQIVTRIAAVLDPH